MSVAIGNQQESENERVEARVRFGDFDKEEDKVSI